MGDTSGPDPDPRRVGPDDHNTRFPDVTVTAAAVGRSAPRATAIDGWRLTVAVAKQRPEALTESDWQNAVLGVATQAGWRHFHTYDARRSVAGYPDLTLVRNGRLIFAELKRQSGKVTAEQLVWLAELGGCIGVDAFVWRPADILVVEAILA